MLGDDNYVGLSEPSKFQQAKKKVEKTRRLTAVSTVLHSNFLTQTTGITLKKTLAEVRLSITAAHRPVNLDTGIWACAVARSTLLKSANTVEWTRDSRART